MRLQRHRTALRILDDAIWSELAAPEHARIVRQLHHLILMRGWHRDRARIVHPRRVLLHLVTMQTDAPAARRLDHLPAECLRHQLMAEADTDQCAAPAG